MEKTRSQAREILYLPGIYRDIENMVAKCSKCAEYRARQQKEPMIPHEIPQRPFEMIGADLFEFGGKDYLCVVDYFSKFPFTRLLRDKTASSVIAHLKSIFAEHGIPEVLRSDNMPFNSREFHVFADSYGFTLTTSSPTYAQSNGMVERMIGTVKQLLRKADDSYIA